MGEGSVGESSQASDELKYFPEDHRRTSSVGIGFILFPAVLGYAAVYWATNSVGLGILAGLGVLSWPAIQRRRAKSQPRATLHVHERSLHLSGPAFAAPRTLDLDDLLDVYLDTKTIQRLREAPSPVPATRFLNQTVGGEQDVARIALELQTETLFLTEERVSHLDANEWFSKIRRFLRQHGWVPEDERALQSGVNEAPPKEGAAHDR
jgi:hypothetical protein